MKKRRPEGRGESGPTIGRGWRDVIRARRFTLKHQSHSVSRILIYLRPECSQKRAAASSFAARDTRALSPVTYISTSFSLAPRFIAFVFVQALRTSSSCPYLSLRARSTRNYYSQLSSRLKASFVYIGRLMYVQGVPIFEYNAGCPPIFHRECIVHTGILDIGTRSPSVDAYSWKMNDR